MISVSKISHPRRSSQEEKKDDHINEVYPNVYHQYEIASHVEKYIYCRDIDSSPDSIQNWNWVLVCCGNTINIKYPKKKVQTIADLNNVFSVTEGTFFSASSTRSHRRHLRRVPLIKIF